MTERYRYVILNTITLIFFVSESLMEIHDYITAGGKNLIKEYIKMRPLEEQRKINCIRHEIILNGLSAFQNLNTRQLQGKLYEIKYSHNRIIYVIKDAENTYFLHACLKQKGKAEKMDLDVAIQRAKEADLDI